MRERQLVRQGDPPGPPSCAPVRCEGDLWGDLDTVGRVTGALLRLLEEKTDHPTPTPSREGRGDAHPPPPVGGARKSKQKVDLKSNA